MATVNINGRQVERAALAQESVSMAREMAQHTRLLDNPLPPDTDLSQEEDKALQTQLHALTILPREVLDDIYIAFSAHHLPALANSLRTLNPDTQPVALANLIQIMSLLPDPKHDPYFRRFLRTSSQMESVPTIVAAAFVRGVAWKRPSGPGHICSLMCHMLQWCDTTLGDDNNASIDSATRKDLYTKVGLLCEDTRFTTFDRIQQVEMKRLHGMLNAVEHMGGPTGYYLTSSRQYLEGSCGDDSCPVCMEEAEQLCSKCKTVRYCGKACQTKDWKAGHKTKCFKALY